MFKKSIKLNIDLFQNHRYISLIATMFRTFWKRKLIKKIKTQQMEIIVVLFFAQVNVLL